MGDVHSFMGLAGHYHGFIQNFLRISHPITSLQRKRKKFVWSDQCEKFFWILKECLTITPILAMLDPLGDFVVCTDAPLEGFGAVLM